MPLRVIVAYALIALMITVAVVIVARLRYNSRDNVLKRNRARHRREDR